MIIKITKHGEQYMVRSKTVKVDDHSYVKYGLPITVYSIDGNTMELRSFIEKDPVIVDYGNGSYIESYRDYTYYSRITLNNGILNYHLYRRHYEEYNQNMRYIGEGDLPSSFPYSKLRLFNDNW